MDRSRSFSHRYVHVICVSWLWIFLWYRFWYILFYPTKWKRNQLPSFVSGQVTCKAFWHQLFKFCKIMFYGSKVLNCNRTCLKKYMHWHTNLLGIDEYFKRGLNLKYLRCHLSKKTHFWLFKNRIQSYLDLLNMMFKWCEKFPILNAHVQLT